MAEDRVWKQVRAGGIDGHKFRRQHPIGRYYADLACEKLRLIVEIDGAVHGFPEVAERDSARQAELEAMGWTVIRLKNREVLDTPEKLIEAVRRHAAGWIG